MMMMDENDGKTHIDVIIGGSERGDHSVDRHEISLDAVHTELHGLAIALHALHNLRILSLNLSSDGISLVREFLGTSKVVISNCISISSFTLHQLAFEGGDGSLRLRNHITHLALTLTQHGNLTTELVGNLHELLASTHERILSRSSGGSRRSRSRSSSGGRSSSGYKSPI